MYYPFLRGKQYELLLLRDNADFIFKNRIHPIIEPVKQNPTALKKALIVLNDNKVNNTLIINPQVGDFSSEERALPEEFLNEILKNTNTSALGFILRPESTISDLKYFLKKYKSYDFSIIHYGFLNGKELSIELDQHANVTRHIFIEDSTSKLYQRQLKKSGVIRILIRDGFKQQKKNANYPFKEHFSDLHITFPDEGMDGFGDFLIVGDDFRESGGPAYAVAIHLTYLDDENDNDMFIYHFVSDQTDSPTNPGGKFMEALNKLVKEVKKPHSRILKTGAVTEYLNLYEKKHYPGLGYVKKLSMKHHLELIAHFLLESNT